MKKKLPIFLLVDRSGSMYGDKIDVVNSSISNFINSLKKVKIYDIFLSIISFSTEAEIILDFKLLSEIKYSPLIADGKTKFSEAIKLMREMFSDLALENSLYPEVILISDGTPTDFNDWRYEVNELIKLDISKGANFNAVFIGDDDGATFINKFLENVNKTHKNKVFLASDIMYIKDFFNNLEIKIKEV